MFGLFVVRRSLQDRRGALQGLNGRLDAELPEVMIEMFPTQPSPLLAWDRTEKGMHAPGPGRSPLADPVNQSME